MRLEETEIGMRLEETAIEIINTEVRIEQPVTKMSYKFAKKTIDIVGALVGLLLLVLVLIPFSFFYSVGSNKGPIFFKQQRIGQNGEVFKIYKFRSMIENAEDVLKKDEILYRKYVANNYKLEPSEDPRITLFGQFIRKTSLDELPQFINVLKGEMSLVGPRPVVEKELDEYLGRADILLMAKPGMTGYWQTCGRSNINYPERVDIELHYIYHQCLLLDLQILCKTIAQVLMRKGAY